MKLYISIDMEGMPGTFNWEHEKVDRSAVKRIMQDHVSDLIEAIRESRHNDDISQIVLADSHSAGDNLDYSITDLDERIYLISGGPRPFYMMPMFDDSFSYVMLLGYHASTGALHANMDHSYSNSRIHKIWLNNKLMSEALLNAAYAGSKNVPVILVSGDLALSNELLHEDAMPWVHYVTTKEAVSKFSAMSYPKALVRKNLFHALNQSLSQPPDTYPLYKFEPPYELKIEFNATSMADQAMLMPYLKRLDGRTVLFTCDEYHIAFEAIMAIVTLASSVGM